MDTDLIQKLLAYDNKVTVILIFIIINVILTLYKEFKEKNLKRLDVEIHSNQIKEVAVIKFTEELYRMMKNISKRLLVFTDPADIRNLIGELSELSDKNDIYISKRKIKIINEFIDYTLHVIADRTKQDVKKEDSFLERFKSEFYKVSR